MQTLPDFHTHQANQKEAADFFRQAATVIDVRSPGEFTSGNVPGSVNVPLFDNMERAAVGTVYRQFGKQASIDLAYRLVLPGSDKLLARFGDYKNPGPIGVICARGGMRSGTVTNFLLQNGFEAFRLAGGYKRFRNLTLQKIDALAFPAGLIVLHGFTGAGKTELISRLPNALCLETLAQHRNSLFGAIGLEPVTQKTFEAGLYNALDRINPEKPVFIEGESSRIGNVTLPQSLRQAMQQGIPVFLDVSLPARLKNTLKTYGELTSAHRSAFTACIARLRYFLGGETTEQILADFEEGNMAAVTEALLSKYYDKKYGHGYKRYSFERIIKSDDPDDIRRQLMAFAASYPAARA